MNVEINIAEMMKPIIREIVDVARFEAKKEVYPEKIQGNALASKLLGISVNTLHQRVYKGFYEKDYHYVKKSDRIYLWNRDALMEMEQENESKTTNKGR